MSYGANQGVKEDEEEYRDRVANEIAHQAAALVACGDYTRTGAIRVVTEWHREEAAASGDVTGVRSIENRFPLPSRSAPKAQVDAIAAELLDAARDAADTL
ncbi:hypothetical protein [Burkholderia glumae]|nr:hypothetical protein [Burkholderia glumae]